MIKVIPGKYTVEQLKNEIDTVEIALTNRFLSGGAITDKGEQNHWKELIEEKSYGRNTVLFDDVGFPSIMVIQHLKQEFELIYGGRRYPHPAFIINDNIVPTLYISKYDNIIIGEGDNARALSLKGVDPQAFTSYDTALNACKNKGFGWHVMTNAEFSLISLICSSQGYLPRGNNFWGENYQVQSEKGIPSHFVVRNNEDRPGRVLTGSGPISWTHDGTPFGIYDLNGNVTNHASGMRLVDGEIQIIPNNDAADSTKDFSTTSTEWKAILEDGTLVEPGSPGTLKFDWETEEFDKVLISTEINHRNPTERNLPFESIEAAQGVTIPNILKLLGIAPIDGNLHQGNLYLNNSLGTEHTARRCGGFMDTTTTGVSFLAVNFPRTVETYNVGFRSAFAYF